MKKLYIIIVLIFFTIFINADINIFKTDNNVDVIYDYSVNRGISAITFLFDGGVTNYNSNKAGIEEFLMQIIQEGSKKYPKDKLTELIDKYGIEISYSVEYDFSYITFKSINEYFDTTLNIAIDLLTEPLFEERAMKNIKAKMLASIKQKQEDPDSYIWDELNKEFFKNHPYSIEIDGTEESINSITKEDLENYLNKLLNNRTIVSIVTGIKENKEKNNVITKLNKFNNTKTAKDFNIAKIKIPEKITRKVLYKDNLMTNYVAAKFVLPSVRDSIYPEIKIGLSVLSRKVYENLRTKHGLTYATWLGASIRKANYGYFYVSTDYPDSAISLAFQEMEKAKNGEITKDDINKLLNQYETSYYMQNSMVTSKAYLNAFNYLIYNDPNYTNILMEKMRNTNTEELKKLFKEYLKNFTFIIITSNKNIKE